MVAEVIVGAVVALIVNEVTDISPWAAVRVARWAAKHIYAANSERAARRSEDWEALISESIPTKISQLCFGLGMGCAGLWCLAIRRVPSLLTAAGRGLGRLVLVTVKGIATVASLAAWITFVDEHFLLSLAITGGLMLLSVVFLVVLPAGFRAVRDTRKRRLQRNTTP